MNKLMIAALVAALPMASAFAAGSGAGTLVCTSGAAAAGGIPGNSANFVKNTILPKCSANVNLAYDQGPVGFTVGANSVKGKNSFGGSTLGGQVRVSAACQAACIAEEAKAAAIDQTIALTDSL